MDPTPAAFALPDAAGLDSPYWKPEIGLTLSEPAQELDDAAKRRVVLEGLLFRIRRITDDLFPAASEGHFPLSTEGVELLVKHAQKVWIVIDEEDS